MTRIITLIFGFLGAVALLFAAFFIMFNTPSKPKDLRFGAPVQIGHDIYQFPRNALDYLPDEGGRPQGVSLRLVFPEMEGRTLDNSKSMDLLNQSSPTLQYLLADRSHPDLPPTAHWTPDQSTGRVAANRLVDNPEKSPTEALKDYEQREMFGGTELVLKSSALRTNYKRMQLDQGDTIIVELKNGKFLTFVECVNAKQYKNPGCNMQFGFRDISVSVHFRRSRLANWREIREKSKVFFETYRLKNISP